MEGDLAVYDLQNGAKRVFKVDRVFGADTDQLAVYEDTQPLIRSVLDGRWTAVVKGQFMLSCRHAVTCVTPLTSSFICMRLSVACGTHSISRS
jgi:hypothetical protein